MKKITAAHVQEAYTRLKSVCVKTPLTYNERLSKIYNARVYTKREDMQIIRSYKLRGAYNRMSLLTEHERSCGVVCASAGNHAQGVAHSCTMLNVSGIIYMPKNTPRQKIARVRALGGTWITIELVGDTFHEAAAAAETCHKETGRIRIHPFNDPNVIAGQGTVALECVTQLDTPCDVMIVPIGGGGLIAGVATYMASVSPHTQVIGAEPSGAASMSAALAAGKPVTLTAIDTFVDGAAVATVGTYSCAIAKKHIETVIHVPTGKVCEEMIALYQTDGIIAEPAGALSVAALEQCASTIVGKTVVCIISGGNNDIGRYADILERALVYQGLKHYFIVQFTQRPGALREFLSQALGPNDDITRFEYIKKSNRESGSALVGIELGSAVDLEKLTSNMNSLGIRFEYLAPESLEHRLLV